MGFVECCCRGIFVCWLVLFLPPHFSTSLGLFGGFGFVSELSYLKLFSYLNIINLYWVLCIPESIFIAEVQLLFPLLPLSTTQNRNTIIDNFKASVYIQFPGLTKKT